MIEFSNLIQVTPINSGKSNSIKTYEFVADPFSYIPQLTDNEAGNYWNCERNATVKIKSSSGQCYQIGTYDIPARVQISSNLTSVNLIIKCKMLTDPLL